MAPADAMGKEQELFRAAKTGDLRTLERLLGQQSKRASVMGRLVINTCSDYGAVTDNTLS